MLLGLFIASEQMHVFMSLKVSSNDNRAATTQLTFTCLKSAIETLEKRAKYAQSQQEKQSNVYGRHSCVNFEHISHLVDFEQVNVN